jgi:hypothetical protein
MTLLGVWKFLVFAHFKDMDMTFAEGVVDLKCDEAIPRS